MNTSKLKRGAWMPRGSKIISRTAEFVKHNAVLTVAIILAAVTAVLVPPDEAYLGYFDLKTLSCLFMTLAVIAALRNIRFFTFVARKIVSATGNLRAALTAVVMITFFGSMLIANDMALITFLPLGYIILRETNNERSMAFLFIMQNIAANLGGMLTPFGNPQNLYIYTRFSVPTGEFMQIMLAPFLAASVMILLLCLVFRPVPIAVGFSGEDGECDEIKLPLGRTLLYLVLFLVTILIVFRLIPYYVGLVLIPLVLIFADRRALAQVDYALLLTFFCFFIFAGNMSRLPAVSGVISYLLNKNTLLVSIASCQVISNVPTAILLSQFTGDYASLLRGVNIGGAGTIIASLASLITFGEYNRRSPGKAGKYLALFTLINYAFVAVLTVVSLIF